MPIRDDGVNLVIADCGEVAGGSQRLLWELATRLPRHRFHAEVWLSTSPGMDPLADALEQRKIGVERIPSVESSWSWRGFLGVWLRLRHARPTLLHLHHAKGSANRLAGVLAEAAGDSRLVITQRTADEPSPPLGRALERRMLARADAVTTVCGAVADTLVREFGLGRSRVRIVRDGIDPPDQETETIESRQLRERLGVGALRPLWVCGERLEPRRGHDILLQALARLHKRGIPFLVAIGGDGSLREALERRAGWLGLSDSVRFLGHLENRGPLLAAADVVVVPSLSEAISHTLLESMMRARPVVASAAGNAPELIEDGQCGRLVPAGDPESLADALEDVYRRPDGALRMGSNAAHRAREEHTWPRVVEAFEAVYDEVLGLASFVPQPSSQAMHRR
jgi:glycosyltransferase involved in cell wall biosynthesis